MTTFRSRPIRLDEIACLGEKLWEKSVAVGIVPRPMASIKQPIAIVVVLQNGFPYVQEIANLINHDMWEVSALALNKVGMVIHALTELYCWELQNGPTEILLANNESIGFIARNDHSIMNLSND